MPLSSYWTTWALFAVDMPSTPSTLSELRLRTRYQPSPSGHELPQVVRGVVVVELHDVGAVRPWT